jgi:hypothetical protein
MGTILRFPAERVRGTLYPAQRPEPAAILILPVVQIERVKAPPLVPDMPGDWPDDWPDHASPAPSFDALPPTSGTRRRRRSPRS